MQDEGSGYPDLYGSMYDARSTYLSTLVYHTPTHPSQMGVVMDAIIAISVDYDPHCQFTHPKSATSAEKSHCTYPYVFTIKYYSVRICM